MSKTYPLGAITDKPDTRDYRLAPPTAPLPVSVDYEHQMSPVRDQGARGSCVAHATLAVKEWQERRQRGFKSPLDLSEEWLYDQIMQPGGGAQPRDAFKILDNVGVCREQYLPYQPNLSDDQPPVFKPTSSAWHSARSYKAASYVRLSTLDELLQSLANHGPCTLALDWLDGWFEPSTEDGNGYPILSVGEGQVVGGHEFALVGFNQSDQYVKFRQSWGPSWGKAGYGYLTFDTVRANLTDAWASVDVSAAIVPDAAKGADVRV